jgi:hypothetical protein
MPVTPNIPSNDPTATLAPTGEPPHGSAAPGDPSIQPPTPPARPEGLPDRYWDEATGVRLNEAAQALSALEAHNAAQTEAFKDFPEKVEEAGKFYALPEAMLPEGMNLPEGVKFEPNTELLERALPVLHKHKVPREAFHDLARAFNAHEVEKFTADRKSFDEDSKKLGANGATRRQDIANRLSAIVGPEKAKFIDASVITSGAVEFFEDLLSKVSNPSVVPFSQNRDNQPLPLPQKLEDRFYGDKQKAS